jgi:NAD(P)-dependent dehydrogenase (short-subunit alcohol dehydrogenase family)
VAALAAAHAERFGRLDVLVNNAGTAIPGPVEGFPTKALDLQLGVNVRGAFLLTRECLPLLRAAGAEHGRALVVNVASVVARHGDAAAAAYSATKHALRGLTQALQGELAGTGVKATAVCPGYVATETLRQRLGTAGEGLVAPEDVGRAVGFLLDLSPACLVPELVLGRAAVARPSVEP